MALKDLISQVRGEKEEKFAYLLTIVIGKTWVTSGIWRIVDDRAQVVAKGTPSSWQEDTEELIKAADDSLSSAVAQLPQEGAEPTKVVFGLPPAWVADAKIKEEELQRLKILSQKLELTPAGFVVVPEAIAYWLKSQEGTPPNVILVGLGEEEIDVSLVRNGQVQGTNTVARSVSLADDVTEGLVRFKSQEPLPSRILIYNHKEAELSEAKQTLLSADFSGLSFLHTPKTESLAADAVLFAISFAGATEVGQASAIEGVFEEKIPEEEIPQEQPEEVEPPQAEPVTAGELGFSEEDIKDLPQPRLEPEAPPPEGFAPEEELYPQRRFPRIPNFSLVFGFWRELFDQATSSFGPKRVTAVVLGTLILLLLAGLFAWWRLPKAEVVIFVAPQKIERELSMVVDPTAESANLEDREIPGRLVDAEVFGEKTKQTTGTKTVGERAKGNVTIRNGTSDSLNLPRGTTVTGPGELEFTLDNSASVSAATSPTTPGTADVAVTAADIGAEHNLAANTQFKVANYSPSDVDAINNSAFSGGTSTEVAAVSEEDQTQLEESLRSELIENAKQDLSAKLSADEVLIDESQTSSTSLSNFSHDIGDQTNTLKLTLRLKVSFLSVSERDIASLIGEELKGDVPQGFVLREDQIESRFEFERERAGRFTFTVLASANLLPAINPQDLAANIAGRSLSQAREYLARLPGYTRSEITLKPRLPGRLGTLPRIPQNITIEIAAER